MQADLTAVAPGPLAHEVAGELRLLADQESRGGGGVFRFSAGSLRRAFDAGWSAAEVHRWLERHSTHRRAAAAGLPGRRRRPPARQHPGRQRAGLPADRRRGPGRGPAGPPGASALGLRSVAPGVLVADGGAAEVVALLHALGHTPAIEDAAGALVTTPARQRAPRRAGATASAARSRRSELAATCWPSDHAHRVPSRMPCESLRSAMHATPGPCGSPTSAPTAAATERQLSPLDVSARSVPRRRSGQRAGGHDSAGPDLVGHLGPVSTPRMSR